MRVNSSFAAIRGNAEFFTCGIRKSDGAICGTFRTSFSANYPLTTFRIPQSAFRKLLAPPNGVYWHRASPVYSQPMYKPHRASPVYRHFLYANEFGKVAKFVMCEVGINKHLLLCISCMVQCRTTQDYLS